MNEDYGECREMTKRIQVMGSVWVVSFILIRFLRLERISVGGGVKTCVLSYVSP